MDTLPEFVTMRTSVDASADGGAFSSNSCSGSTKTQTEVLRKLSEGGFDAVDLPLARNDPL